MRDDVARLEPEARHPSSRARRTRRRSSGRRGSTRRAARRRRPRRRCRSRARPRQRRDDELVVHAQGEAERVEAGAEVRAGRGHADDARCVRHERPERHWRSRGRAATGHEVSPRTEAHVRRGRVDHGRLAPAEPSALRSAHCGSFRPWPVTVSTTRAPAGMTPASTRSRRPATLIADAGSTKMPTSPARSFCAARMRSSSIAPNQPSVASRASQGELPRGGVADADRAGDRLGVLHDLAEHERGRACGLEAEHARARGWRRRARPLRGSRASRRCSCRRCRRGGSGSPARRRASRRPRRRRSSGRRCGRG